jgi:hypothetical protein
MRAWPPTTNTTRAGRDRSQHLGWYVKGLPDSADLRRRLHAVNERARLKGFAEYLESQGQLQRASVEALAS